MGPGMLLGEERRDLQGEFGGAGLFFSAGPEIPGPACRDANAQAARSLRQNRELASPRLAILATSQTDEFRWCILAPSRCDAASPLASSAAERTEAMAGLPPAPSHVVKAFLAAVVVSASVVAAPAFHPAAQVRVPASFADPSSDACLIVVPPDWRERPPFAPRFSVARATPGDRRHVIDLAAIRFETDALRSNDANGLRSFLAPDLSSFRPGLVREAFSRGLPDFLIVQAPGPTSWSSSATWLEDEGVEIAGYIPDDAYLVRLEPRLMGVLRGHARVFWAGLFQPAFRVEPKLELIIGEDAARAMKLRANFDLAEYRDEHDLLADLKRTSLALLEIERTELYWTVILQGAAEQAFELARAARLPVGRALRGVRAPQQHRPFRPPPSPPGAAPRPARSWTSRTSGRAASAVRARSPPPPTPACPPAASPPCTRTTACRASSTNPMRVIKGYALGRTTTWDDNQTTGGGHGTHTSGSIVGNGFRSGSDPSTNSFPSTSFAGNAPKAQFVFQSVMDSGGNLGGLPSDLTTLFQSPYNDGARVHSNSWGSASAGAYDATSQQLDKFVWNNKDMVITFSAGNSGVDGKVYGTSCTTNGKPIDGVIDTDSIGAPGTAKNCITVGASENYRPDFVYEYPANDCTSSDGVEQKTWGWFNSCSYSVSPDPGRPRWPTTPAAWAPSPRAGRATTTASSRTSSPPASPSSRPAPT